MEGVLDVKTRALIQGLIAVIALGVSTLGMLWRAEPFATWYYPLAWWPFILGVDALVLALQGHSLLTRNPKEFLFLAAISAPIWLIFEAWNLALQNWYYMRLTPSLLVRWAGYAVSFATVLPAVFETAELAGVLRSPRDVRVRPIRVGSGLYAGFWLTGALCLAFPLLVPKYTFPLIWLGFIFLLEPFNHRWARRSLLREWEQGTLRTLVRLLVGGMICGLVWEIFNFGALAKWVYTVPFFEELKLFEMPLGGFLGFPPFAVECYVMVQFIGIFRGGKGWEAGTERASSASLLPRALQWSIVGLVVAGSLGMFHLLDRYTVNSLHPRVVDLRELAPQEVFHLQAVGVDRLDILMERPGAWRTFSERAELAPDALMRWRNLAVLSNLKGMGTENVRLLWSTGICSVGELAKQDPQALGPKLRTIQSQKGWARQSPRDAQVRLWVRAARKICEKASHGHKFGCE